MANDVEFMKWKSRLEDQFNKMLEQLNRGSLIVAGGMLNDSIETFANVLAERDELRREVEILKQNMHD